MVFTISILRNGGSIVLLLTCIVFGTIRGDAVSRNDSCASIERSVYEIEISATSLGYHYISVAYDLSQANNAQVHPSIQITLPTDGSSFNYKICCDSVYPLCKSSCETSAAYLSPGQGHYYLILNTNAAFTQDLRYWGVRYFSLEIYFEVTKANGKTQNSTTGVTLALYDCTPRPVAFVSGSISTEEVKVRRLAFLNGNGNGNGFGRATPVIDVYSLSARLNGPKPEDAFFTVMPRGATPDFMFSIRDNDFLQMRTDTVSLKTNDLNYDVTVQMKRVGSSVPQEMPLRVVARAENRYSPVFLSCTDPETTLYLENSVESACSRSSCHITELKAMDYDGDSLYFHSFEVLRLSSPKGDWLNGIFSYNLVQFGNTTEYSIVIWQNRKLTEDDLHKWAEVSGLHGFLLLQVHVRDRTDPSGRIGTCTMKINYPTSLATISKVPTFISPRSDLKIHVPEGFSSMTTPIVQVAAVDWLRQKLEYPLRTSRSINYKLEYNSRNGKAATPFYISSDGNIYVNGTLDQAPKTYLLTVSASFGSASDSYRRNLALAAASSASVSITIDVLPKALENNWTPRFDVTDLPSVPDGIKEQFDSIAEVLVLTPSSFLLEDTDLKCYLLDYSSSWKGSVACSLSNEMSGRYRVRIALKQTGTEAVSLDYSEDRFLHFVVGLEPKLSSVAHHTQAAVIVKIRDENKNFPIDYGTKDFTIPEDAPAGEHLMTLKLFDADLDKNGGISCRVRINCHSSQGGNSVISFKAENSPDSGALHLNSSFPPNSYGECLTYIYDSYWSPSTSSCQSSSIFQDFRGTSQVTVLQQPVTPPAVSLFCPDGVPQLSPLLTAVSRCRVGAVHDGEVPGDSPNMYFFVTDPTGTFAANPANGSIYLLQPIIFNASTTNALWLFPIQISVFNGRFWNSTIANIKVVNNNVSPPNLIDIYDFASPSGDISIDGTPHKLRVPAPSNPDSSSPILNLTLKSSAAKLFQYSMARMPRSLPPAYHRPRTSITTTIAPFLVGPTASFYALREVFPNTKWSLYYIGDDSSTSTLRYRQSQARSIIGSGVTIAVKYTVNQTSSGSSLPLVTIGNTADVTFVEAVSPRVVEEQFPLWAILVIVFGVIFLILVGLLAIFLVSKRKKQKVGSPDLPGTPVKYVTGQLPSFTPIPPPVMSPNPELESEFALDALLARRLANADATLTASGGARAGDPLWHGDDGLDTITVSSGYTDAPLNLSVLNQLGAEYSGLAETCGVARRV